MPVNSGDDLSTQIHVSLRSYKFTVARFEKKILVQNGKTGSQQGMIRKWKMSYFKLGKMDVKWKVPFFP